MSDYQSLLSNLPIDWKTHKISELGYVVSGGTPSRAVTSFWEGETPWLTPGEVSKYQGKYLANTAEYITDSGLQSSGANLLPEGSLLVTSRATLGARVINQVPMTTNQGFKSIVFHAPEDADYYFHFFSLLKTELERRASGTTFLEISGTEFSDIDLPVPPESERDRINEILDTLDTQIRETESIIAKLQQVKQGLLHDLLTRGVDENGELRPSYDDAPELYKQSHSVLGFIPKSWNLVTLEDIASVNRGQFTHRPRNDPAFYGGEFPFIQTGDITSAKGGILTSFTQTLSEKGTGVSLEFPDGTIAITIAANIADTAILGLPMYFPDSIVGAIPIEGLSSRFVELSVRRMKKYLDSRAPQSAQKNINLQDLRPLPIGLPTSSSEINKISQIYDELETQLSTEKLSFQKLQKKKSGLMDDLLTGKKRVTDLLPQQAN